MCTETLLNHVACTQMFSAMLFHMLQQFLQYSNIYEISFCFVSMFFWRSQIVARKLTNNMEDIRSLIVVT